ncbi:hypothetical protein GCM10007320_28530 [Pseudorhodoferax aquiterrae]|uniref:Type II secretion system protein GspC N-terminal domain-containing protein n=1 Tax=Pseudorhodoferax aquiterrae TaxID=747304 RepID=A0ABQ3G216_9BURK|nr:hypothetical protein [Pseudorhodoferax aquiterrae]GHC84251.1 hypothetical protein GCM10007320_28530 [Pseudorhodoferax aquiterrae]
MKAPALRVLAALCAALGLVLVALWVTPQGALRASAQWQAPAPHLGDYRAGDAASAQRAAPDAQRQPMLLDRPLFAKTRRPPEPAAPAPVDTAPDRLGQARLRAIVDGGPAGSAVILEIDGKSHRIARQGGFEGWTLASVSPEAQTVTLTRRGQTRVLALQRGQLSAAAGRGRAAGARRLPSRPGSPAVPNPTPAQPGAGTEGAAAALPAGPAQR